MTLGSTQAVNRITETTVQALFFSFYFKFFFCPLTLQIPSSFPLISPLIPSMLGSLPGGIVECHHIPGWHSCLDIAEVPALARAACREETGTGSQGLSAHLLPEPVREPSFITSTDAKSSSCHSGNILSCDCCTLCMFGFGLCIGGIPSSSFCLIHWTYSSSQIIFQKEWHLETASRFFPLLYLISVMLLREGGVYKPTEEELTMQPASVLWLPLSSL